jgi:hypothetical protein
LHLPLYLRGDLYLGERERRNIGDHLKKDDKRELLEHQI